MNEYRCPCGWGATARTLEGMLAASEHHQREGCATNETGEDGMKIDLDALEAVARAVCVPGAWTIWHDLDHQGFKTVGDAESYAEMKKTGEADECDPIARVYTDDLAEHIATFDPPTARVLITRVREAESRLREAEAVIEAARESEARTKFIAWGRKPTHEDSSHTWRILSAYKPTNQEGGAS